MLILIPRGNTIMATREPISDPMRAAIEYRSRLFEQAYLKGNARALVESYFVEDALGPLASPPGGQPLVRGHRALIELFSGMFAAIPEVRLSIIELIPQGDGAFELGRAKLTGADGARMDGRYTVCWLKVSDGWRARIDFFAADGWPGD
jgi:ketosteroid isomerase-like protein